MTSPSTPREETDTELEKIRQIILGIIDRERSRYKVSCAIAELIQNLTFTHKMEAQESLTNFAKKLEYRPGLAKTNSMYVEGYSDCLALVHELLKEVL